MSSNPIPVHPAAAQFEREYNLPELQGSPRQVQWATNIRYNVLKIILTYLMESIPRRANAASYYAVVGAMRSESLAKAWIEKHRRGQTNPLDHLVVLVAETENVLETIIKKITIQTRDRQDDAAPA